MSIKACYMVPHPPMIVKEIGGDDVNKIKETEDAYESIAREIGDMEIDTIIISSPHTKIYSDYFHILDNNDLKGSFEEFGHPEVHFEEENDFELVNKIDELCKRDGFPGGFLDDHSYKLDHGTMVPLYFVRKYLGNYKIVVIGISGFSYVDHYIMGSIIKEAVTLLDRNVIYIASGDLSHKLQEYGPYGYIEEGPIYDKEIMDVMSKGDFGKLLEFDPNMVEKAAVCGHKSFCMMAGFLDGLDVKSTYYSHQDITGVGYGICSYYPIVEDDNRLFLNKYLNKEIDRLNDIYSKSDSYVLLARKTIYEYIKNNKIIDIDGIDKELLNKKAGVFVSIHEFNNLRGCIGTISSTTDCIAKEIINNAISASTKDYRFDPIREDELDFLEINVDVLMEPEVILDKSMLDVKRYGVIVSSGSKRGLLLPDIDGVDSVDDQIEIAMRKGNISKDDNYILERFEVIRHR